MALNKNIMIGVGIIGATLLGVWFAIRKMGYANIETAINSAMGNYFTISELCASDVAKAKGIDNTPTSAIKSNLEKLIVNMLNPIREKYGKPIKISSGYRCAALNSAVGGTKTSQHLKGEAADLVCAGSGKLADIMRAAIAVGGYDQLIWEHPKGTTWVHVSYNTSGKQRGEILDYDGVKYTRLEKKDVERVIGKL